MNICSLPLYTVVDIYLSCDEKTKINFSRVCTYFRDIKKAVDIYSKTHKFILDNYDIIKVSSSIKELTIPIMFRWNAVSISEYHCCKQHRLYNSQLINLLWQQNLTEIYLECPDDTQIPHSINEIKSQIQCWDSGANFKEHLFTMMHGMCEVSKAYVTNFEKNTFKFAAFFRCYTRAERSFHALKENPNFTDFYSIAEVRKICTNGINEKSPKNRKKHLVELNLYLQQEAYNILNYINNQINAHNDARNLSIANAACRSINSKKIPLIVAGHSHTVSKMMQIFSKTKGVLCVALKPKSKGHDADKALKANKIFDLQGSERQDIDILLQICDAVDAETEFWSEATTLLRVQSIEPENLTAFSLANQHLFLALKAKIKQYSYNTDDIYLWAELPLLIYGNEILRMEINTKHPDANVIANPHAKKRKIDVS